LGEHEQRQQGLAFYIDGHVRVYHGELTALPRHYVARERLYLRATVDYWVNALDGQPFLYTNKEVDHGLVAALRDDLTPWLEANAPISEEHRQRMAADPRTPRFTLIFDREGYSPELSLELQKKRIAVLTYHRYPKEDWPRAKTLTVCLHHLTQAAHDEAARYLCDELNATETIFPGTDLRLVYKLGSS
jgi:hypothetical protein